MTDMSIDTTGNALSSTTKRPYISAKRDKMLHVGVLYILSRQRPLS